MFHWEVTHMIKKLNIGDYSADLITALSCHLLSEVDWSRSQSQI